MIDLLPLQIARHRPPEGQAAIYHSAINQKLTKGGAFCSLHSHRHLPTHHPVCREELRKVVVLHRARCTVCSVEQGYNITFVLIVVRSR